MSLNDLEKINYIKNNFHQYFTLELNKDLDTTETVNLVIPIETLMNEDVVTDSLNRYTHNKKYLGNFQEILNKYDDTIYADESIYPQAKIFDSINNYIGISKNSLILKEFNFNNVIEISFFVKTSSQGHIKVTIEEIGELGVVDVYELENEYISNQNWEEKTIAISNYISNYNNINNENQHKFILKIENDGTQSPIYINNLLLKNKYNSLNIIDFNDMTSWGIKGTISTKKHTDGLIPAKCTNVVDGDTIDVIIPYQKELTGSNISYKEERVRLVGVNAPEQNSKGAEETKNLLKDICLNKEIFLKIDNKKQRDNYNRVLAVVIVKNKNINEIILKEGFGEIMFIPPSEFNPYEWGTTLTPVHRYNFQNDDINVLGPYFNYEMTNIVFTPANDFETIYRYEIYKNVIYVKLNPYANFITMHLLPKHYDCSDEVLFFKDDMIDNINVSEDYYYDTNKNPINSYYQINGENRDRNNPDISSEEYDINDWENTFCYFSHDISKSTENMSNVEICAGYRYNNTTPFYSIHFTGIKDNTSTRIEDRCVLVDANFDSIEAFSSGITQFHFEDDELFIPKDDRDMKDCGDYGNIDHISQINQLHHKKIKYINDMLYCEEDINKRNNNYGLAFWEDLSD